MNQATAKSILDMRSIEPGKRNAMVFNSFDELNPGESLQLINDQDTAPLHFQFLRENLISFHGSIWLKALKPGK